eukprot:1059189-Pleurochrysis_carterae.AAC.1
MSVTGQGSHAAMCDAVVRAREGERGGEERQRREGDWVREGGKERRGKDRVGAVERKVVKEEEGVRNRRGERAKNSIDVEGQRHLRTQLR